jgi:dTDP-4-dehydrorhamnose reductase
MYRFLRDAGIADEEIGIFAGGEAAPDVIGINHYLTSERFLDHRIHLYPGHPAGGNGRDTYVDAEAVRVRTLEPDTGIAPRLREAWERYRLPLAVTEVHHGSHRDEQLRWATEVWTICRDLRDEGVDMRAVTLWSMFGNVDWRFLLTARHGFYDVGVFDVRAEAPRPTMLARAAKAWAKGEDFDHPVLDSPGWWRRPPRLYPWNGRCKPLEWGGRKLLITGATGTLGGAFARICEERALPFCLTGRAELDICDEDSIATAIAAHKPWAIVNTAGFVRVPDAEREREACMAANTLGPEKLARACRDAGIPFVTFSSDLVFDGRLGRAYREGDAVNPTGTYGLSKARAESRVRGIMGEALIVRTSAFFGPWDRYNFAWNVLFAVARGEPVRACPNTEISPTYVPDLCHTTLDLLIDGEKGVWHLANQGRLSWYDFAYRVAEGAGFDPSLVQAAPAAEPGVTALDSVRGPLMRPFESALEDYLDRVRDALPIPEAGIAAE